MTIQEDATSRHVRRLILAGVVDVGLDQINEPPAIRKDHRIKTRRGPRPNTKKARKVVKTPAPKPPQGINMDKVRKAVVGR